MRKRTGTRVHRDAFHLTPRQQEVVGLMARGYTNAQIADALGITLDGAKAHVSEIISRLDVTTREEAVAAWQDAGRRSWLGGLAGLGLVKVGAAAVGVVVVGLSAALWFGPGDMEPPPDDTLVQCVPYAAEDLSAPGETFIVDYAPFVRFGDITYVSTSAPARIPIERGAPYGRVAVNVVETPPDPFDSVDCSSAFLPAGTLLYAIEGFEPTFRLATESGEMFQAYGMSRNGQGGDFIDIVGKVDSLRLGPMDTSAPSVSVDLDPLVTELAEAIEIGVHNAGRHPRSDWSMLYVHFVLFDGTGFGGNLTYADGFKSAAFNQIAIPSELAERVVVRYHAGVFGQQSPPPQLQQSNLVECPEPVGAGTQLNPAVDFVDSVTFEGITYLHRAFGETAGTVPPDAIGEPYGEVNLSLHNSPFDVWGPAPDCSAAFLPPGTILYTVIGSDPSERLALADGRVYEVYEPD